MYPLENRREGKNRIILHTRKVIKISHNNTKIEVKRNIKFQDINERFSLLFTVAIITSAQLIDEPFPKMLESESSLNSSG